MPLRPAPEELVYPYDSDSVDETSSLTLRKNKRWGGKDLISVDSYNEDTVGLMEPDLKDHPLLSVVTRLYRSKKKKKKIEKITVPE